MLFALFSTLKPVCMSLGTGFNIEVASQMNNNGFRGVILRIQPHVLVVSGTERIVKELTRNFITS
jgi:hypothetical protein